MKKIAVLVSGGGSNAEKIFNYFEAGQTARVVLMISDNASAYALERAARLGVPSVVVGRREEGREEKLLTALEEAGADLVVLAGYLSLVPPRVVSLYAGRMVNIHPALLPAYGGKGMYGDNVHRAVIAGGEKESGITIHYVNECYDEGAVIAQFRTAVTADDTPESLAEKIHELEYRHFPEVIKTVLDRL